MNGPRTCTTTNISNNLSFLKRLVVLFTIVIVVAVDLSIDFFQNNHNNNNHHHHHSTFNNIQNSHSYPTCCQQQLQHQQQHDVNHAEIFVVDDPRIVRKDISLLINHRCHTDDRLSLHHLSSASSLLLSFFGKCFSSYSSILQFFLPVVMAIERSHNSVWLLPKTTTILQTTTRYYSTKFQSTTGTCCFHSFHYDGDNYLNTKIRRLNHHHPHFLSISKAFPKSKNSLFLTTTTKSSLPSSSKLLLNQRNDDSNEMNTDEYPPLPNHHHHLDNDNDNNNNTVSPTTVPIITTTASSTKKEKQQGYQFGDITRSLLQKQTTNQKKKKNETMIVEADDFRGTSTSTKGYRFGDLTRYVTKTATNQVIQLTGKDQYQFGDVTRWVDQLAKNTVANYTGKGMDGENNNNNNNNNTYEFGDITKTVVRKVQNGEYTLSDLYLLFRVLGTIGLNLVPVLHVIPIQVLFNILNFGLVQDVSIRVLEIIANHIDQRLKLAITGDRNYQLGDVTKRKLIDRIQSYTGKDTYEVGDFSKTFLRNMNRSSQNSNHNNNDEQQLNPMSSNQVENSSSNSNSRTNQLLSIVDDDDFAEWDQKLIHAVNDKK